MFFVVSVLLVVFDLGEGLAPVSVNYFISRKCG